MLISQLPTARLRARAFELSGGKDKQLDEAFCFEGTPETDLFWGAVFEQEWFTAMSMQPRLFEIDASEVDKSVNELNDMIYMSTTRAIIESIKEKRDDVRS